MISELLHDPMEQTLHRCREWLTYRPPSRRSVRPADIAIPATRFDKEGGPSGTVGMGPYRIVLKECQFYWAAETLPPMYRDAAFQRRRERDIRRVTVFLWHRHRDEWLEWTAAHRDRPGMRLIEECAQQMALKLGEDLI